ncbi:MULTISPECIES: GNAT family N-acetyltransferase [Bifidobacterium]|uniref:GNAT family N-acetyltransferase n=2 Tax=Bifidobacterium tibiigranuli TaxID=2172043 RepID=A0A5N6S7M0_9BIFI|nr:GNAT family N-acetyltransferase [Bifidobacterium tibiigranuli]KAE8130030.1 GNAT family N-acetyltransferase [Bifidobacterium tibiigranuli]KAE8130612.1 GNAT family N-acetyltransferase [Bifidobacterium tibiigranuli]MCH4189442.1 GNAT family N-acetyltransferase [Bifidobacterium tibiigranuli]MCI1210492.1 GNAT family N-acetyltransferase [Bifidobacterium tibiigranuli]MCI1220996.1 GNAT family N-acetyltransferase [Bifidobacterium tibiigranuli]
MTSNYTFTASVAIGDAQYRQIMELEKACREYEDVDSKLELDFKTSEVGRNQTDRSGMNEFFCYERDALVGYLGVCSFDSAVWEVNGMVRPSYRRQGIFTELFRRMLSEFNARSPQELLLLSDKKSASGLRFIERLHANYHHAEYDMVLNASDFEQHGEFVEHGGDSSSLLRSKSALDIQETDAKQHTFTGTIDGKIIGSVRLELLPDTGGIYALEVVPEYRGHGYGRALLNWSIAKLISMGAKTVILQVDTDNARALNLYTSAGFVEKSVMLYHSLPKGN